LQVKLLKKENPFKKKLLWNHLKYGTFSSVPEKTAKQLKEKVRGFAVDAETDKLINAGSKLFLDGKGKPSISRFLRECVHQYFSK
jgi:hypothetical protein